MRKTVLQNLVTYAIAAAIVWYAARGVSWRQVADAAGHATLWLFHGASLGGFLCWFVGETILYSRLFSYFHGPTGARELLPTMAAVYFLQIINSYVASGAYVLFLHARKRVPWITGVGTLMFQTYVDVMLLAVLSLFAIAVVPTSPIRLGLLLRGRCACAQAVSSPRFGSCGERGSVPAIGSDGSMSGRRLLSFRMARPSHYIKLLVDQVPDFSGRGLRALRTVREFSYPRSHWRRHWH